MNEAEVGVLLRVVDDEAVKVPTGIRDRDLLCKLVGINSLVDTILQLNELFEYLIIFEHVRAFQSQHRFIILSFLD